MYKETSSVYYQVDTDSIKSQISEAYLNFFHEQRIDLKTGIWMNAPHNRELRFACMPHIGSKYGLGVSNRGGRLPRILFVGQDIGCDDGKLLSFKEREINNINLQKLNPHIAGTYIAILKIFKHEYPEAYSLIDNMRGNINTTAVKVNADELPQDLLDYVVLTNFYKFVTVGRGKEKKEMKDDMDRQYFRIKKKILDLFRKEILVFKPDIVWFQGSVTDENYKIIEDVMNQLGSGCSVYRTYHPSGWKYGQNKVDYTLDFPETSINIGYLKDL